MSKTARFFSFLVAAAMILTTVVFADPVSITVSHCDHGKIVVTYTDTADKSTALTEYSGTNGTTTVSDEGSLTVTATPDPGYELNTLTAGDKTIENGDTVTPTGGMTFSASFTPKNNAGDNAKISGYTLEGVYTSLTNCKKDSKKSGSEIIEGNYVNLKVFVTDPDFTIEEFQKAALSGAVSITEGSAFRPSAYTDINNIKVTKTDKANTYTIELKGLSYNGKSNTLELLVTGGSYNAKLSATIKNASPSQSSGTPDTPTQDPTSTDAAKPYVIISSYNYGQGDLVAGGTRDITMTFYNTSKDLDVENMIVSMSLPSDAMVLTSSSNTFYIEKLEAGKSITKTVNITVKPAATAESHAMELSFNYEYIDSKVRKSGSTTESISMPVVQVDRFNVTGVSLEPQISVGEESNVSASYVNMGRGDIYNVTAKLNCDKLTNNGEEQYLGNLASGATSSADFYLTAAEEGALTGEIVITYEDSSMNKRTVSIPFTTTAAAMSDQMMNPNDMGIAEEPMMEPTGGGVAWYWIVLGVAVVGGGVTFAVLQNRKKKESVEEDADL